MEMARDLLAFTIALQAKRRDLDERYICRREPDEPDQRTGLCRVCICGLLYVFIAYIYSPVAGQTDARIQTAHPSQLNEAVCMYSRTLASGIAPVNRLTTSPPLKMRTVGIARTCSCASNGSMLGEPKEN
jgi:hypothetical protein